MFVQFVSELNHFELAGLEFSTSLTMTSPCATCRPSVSMGVNSVTVGTAIASCPPYRSVRAELPHTAPTSDDWRRNERQEKDAGHEGEVSIVRRSGECASNWDGCVDCDGQASTATDRTTGHGSAITPAGFREPRGIGNSH